MLEIVIPTTSKAVGISVEASGALLNVTRIAFGLPRLDACTNPNAAPSWNEISWKIAVALGPPLCRLTAKPTNASLRNGPPPLVQSADVAVSWVVIKVPSEPSVLIYAENTAPDRTSRSHALGNGGGF